uniref:Uncharacterized protein n=1 Tax=Anguilla anguilla TaxID=7936 RepID=A0A0E9RTQ6_ANGAN
MWPDLSGLRNKLRKPRFLLLEDSPPT